MRVIRSASRRPLAGHTIAVLGYGSQGRAQSLNLRDAGYVPLVGLPAGSKSRRTARAEGFDVVAPTEAVRRSSIVFVLGPDHLHGRLMAEIKGNLRRGQTLVFAHASSVHFGTVRPPDFVDVILLAPLGPGQRLRELAWKADGVPCFFAIHQDPSRRARGIGLALADVIGCLPAGAIRTTFAEEAIGDLFGEQAVLCGGLGELLKAGVETLMTGGITPENAYLECVYQLDLIVDLVKQHGLAGMYERVSPTAAYGARVAGPRIVDKASRAAMRQVLANIKSGRFFHDWTRQGTRQVRLRPTVSREYSRAERNVLRRLNVKVSKREQ